MTVTPQVVDFSGVLDQFEGPTGKFGRDSGESPYIDGDRAKGRWDSPRSSTGRVLTAKQVRKRARRKMARSNIMTPQEYGVLYKPVEEWDMEELARGRPRNSRGTFTGPRPKWLSSAVHEAAMERFKVLVKSDMNRQTVNALQVFEEVMSDDRTDNRGRPLTSATTKLDAAKFLLEHVVGKPTQRLETDVSVRLQSILGVVIANPGVSGEYQVGHLPGVTVPMAIETSDDDVLDADVLDAGEIEEGG